MTGYIFYSEKDYLRNKWFANELENEFHNIGVFVKIIITEKCTLVNNISEKYFVYESKQIINADFAIIRTINPTLSFFLNEMGIKCFNNYETSVICNNKFLSYSFVSGLGIKTIPTLLSSQKNIDFQTENAFSLFETDKLVIKTVSGHGGKEVFLLEKESYKNTVNSIKNINPNNDEFCIQPKIGTIARDMRVYVLGKKIYATMLRTSDTSYKSNFTLGGKCQEAQLTENQVEIINKIINNMTSDFVGIDFLFDDNDDMYFNEIEDVVGTRMLYYTEKYNPIKDYTNYIIKKLC